MRYNVRTLSLVWLSLFTMCQSAIAQDDPSYVRDTTVYLSRSEYMYADNPRYTFFGHTPRRETKVETLPAIALGVGYVGIFITLHVIQTNAWWADDRGSFHVQEDWPYANQVDKFGHFYSAYVMSTAWHDILAEAGMSQTPSVIVGGALGLAYQTYVEIEDGYAKNWGFSPSDAISNAIGAGYFVAQSFSPFLQNFTPRWNYTPSSWSGEQPLSERPATFIDDYNSTTFWLAMNVNNLLPNGAVKDIWPDWLMLDIGYGIRSYGVSDPTQTQAPVQSRFMVGLDYDWVKIIPPSSVSFLNYLRQSLNYIRFPGPTLEFTSDGASFRFFYPIKITVPF
jgi:hypothetical protein